MSSWFVYIMTNRPNGVLYIGVTDDLKSRVQEHKEKLYSNSFSSRYNLTKLVYFEEFNNGNEASVRERQMKKWKRDWKLQLINDMNPQWMDIALNWYNVNTVFKTERNLKPLSQTLKDILKGKKA